MYLGKLKKQDKDKADSKSEKAKTGRPFGDRGYLNVIFLDDSSDATCAESRGA
jgi:hypothetical protein